MQLFVNFVLSSGVPPPRSLLSKAVSCERHGASANSRQRRAVNWAGNSALSPRTRPSSADTATGGRAPVPRSPLGSADAWKTVRPSLIEILPGSLGRLLEPGHMEIALVGDDGPQPPALSARHAASPSCTLLLPSMPIPVARTQEHKSLVIPHLRPLLASQRVRMLHVTTIPESQRSDSKRQHGRCQFDASYPCRSLDVRLVAGDQSLHHRVESQLQLLLCISTMKSF
jgi:hypothetical protein